MKFIYTILFLASLTFAKGQITLIPDQNFELALIDQNIDSDGTINGQVFTNDINSLNDLDLGFNFISDLTGLQDFAQLQNLTIDNLDLSNSNLTLDLTANTLLETFIMNGGDDAFTHDIEKIDLSDNPNINLIQTPGIWPLRQIDLKTGTEDVSNLNISISVGAPFAPPNNLFCIKVTDEAAATAGTGVYSTWTITANNNPYYFSETCTLSSDRFKEPQVSIYPNPAIKVLNIEAHNFQINSIKVFNLQGQLVKQIDNSTLKSIDVSPLAFGLYVIHIESNNGLARQKFLKQ